VCVACEISLLDGQPCFVNRTFKGEQTAAFHPPQKCAKYWPGGAPLLPGYSWASGSHRRQVSLFLFNAIGFFDLSRRDK
jgi:hypothetical protein